MDKEGLVYPLWQSIGLNARYIVLPNKCLNLFGTIVSI